MTYRVAPLLKITFLPITDFFLEFLLGENIYLKSEAPPTALHWLRWDVSTMLCVYLLFGAVLCSGAGFLLAAGGGGKRPAREDWTALVWRSGSQYTQQYSHQGSDTANKYKVPSSSVELTELQQMLNLKIIQYNLSGHGRSAEGNSPIPGGFNEYYYWLLLLMYSVSADDQICELKGSLKQKRGKEIPFPNKSNFLFIRSC